LKLKLRNKILLAICILIILDIIISFGFNIWQKNIYNNNYKIVQQGDSYTYKNKTGTQNSSDEIDLKYSGFSGDDTIWILNAHKDCEITLDYNSTVNSGDFKIVLINPEKEIENILEGTAQGNKTIKLTKGECRFKIVGRNTDGEVKLSIIDESKNIDISSLSHSNLFSVKS